MKKLAILTPLSSALCLATFSATATTFNFSYQFTDYIQSGPGLVTGQLEGDLSADGKFVENVHNVSLFFDGTKLPGPVIPQHWNPSAFDWQPGCVVSFDAVLNNFVFADDPHFPYNGALGYLIFAPAYTIPLADFSPNFAFFAYDNPKVYPANWSLVAVPDGGWSITMLATAMATLTWFRRKVTAFGHG